MYHDEIVLTSQSRMISPHPQLGTAWQNRTLVTSATVDVPSVPALAVDTKSKPDE
jgi:hypothetical protein